MIDRSEQQSSIPSTHKSTQRSANSHDTIQPPGYGIEQPYEGSYDHLKDLQPRIQAQEGRRTRSQDSIYNRVHRSLMSLFGHGVMACPHCGVDMVARLTKAELHVDPTGYGVYECRNESCNFQPRYRRSDIPGYWEAQERRSQDAIRKQAEEIKAGHQASQALNDIVTVIRNSAHKNLLDGRYKSVAQVVQAILDAKVVKVAQAPPPGPPPQSPQSQVPPPEPSFNLDSPGANPRQSDGTYRVAVDRAGSTIVLEDGLTSPYTPGDYVVFDIIAEDHVQARRHAQSLARERGHITEEATQS
jgi:Zn-finger nucleic acid-binding protein